MRYDEDSLKNKFAVIKFVFENPGAHRNVVRKKLLQKGKISSKSKFFVALEELIAEGKIKMENELLTLAESQLELGVLQHKGDDYYIVTPISNKHYKVDPSVAYGFRGGDLLEVVIEKTQTGPRVLILGKSQRKLPEQQSKKPKTAEGQGKKGNLVLGRVLKISHDQLVFIPNKKSITARQIPILNNPEDCAAFQDKICVMNLLNLDAPLMGGYIVSVKGEAGNPIHEYDAIAESYGAIMSWEGEKLQAEIDRIPSSVDTDSLELITESDARFGQKGKVVDLRHIPFVTVDPATCKDMDDAIYSRFNENGDVVVYTAVANATKYVDLFSEIGKRYVTGGFTIYAPNKAYNILPTQLSTGICSLNPNVERLAFVVKTVIDSKTGKVKSSNIYDAIIESRHKYSYEEAQKIVDELDPVVDREDLLQKTATGEVLTDEEQVLMNYYAGQIIKLGFENRRMIRFVANHEREIHFDQDMQDVVDITPIPHLFYHEVIEAFMVTANEATAKYARDNSLDNIFRVHDEPNPKKLARANEFFEILGIDFDGDLSASGTRALIELIRGTANEEVINNFLIKMQSRAVYSDHLYGKKRESEDESWMGERISHYALQSPHYSHTTSIIRRVPDYVTQYNILAHIHQTKPLSASAIQKIVEIANARQLDVDQAEKDFEDISSVMYCEKHIGEKLTGRITKIRTASPEEGYDDEIIVIVKNDEKGVNAEIPLSQILGRNCDDCVLSEQRCAVYDKRGNIVLTLCKPLEFIIEKADRKAMVVVGRTNKEMVRHCEQTMPSRNSSRSRADFGRTDFSGHKRGKLNRADRIKSKHDHRSQEEPELE